MRDHCAKCGDMKIVKRYDPPLDLLRMTCAGCGHSWNESPLDRKSTSESLRDLVESGRSERSTSSAE